MNAPSVAGARTATSTTVATTVMTVFIAVVWGANGLWAKILGEVPRHAQIVARVVGDDLAPALTVLIGVSELVMLAWFLSGRQARLNTAAQVGIVMTMNVIEAIVASDLLLFGPFNFVFACAFCAVVVGRHRLMTARGGA